MTNASSAVLSDLAPTGVLRAGINYGNPVLVQRDPAGGEPRGVAPDLARELARRLGVAIRFATYEGAGKMADAVKAGEWDVAFLAIDPERAAEITFTAPYVEIEGTYLVPQASPLRTIEDVDREGVRVAVGAKSAYDLYLTRHLARAQIVRSPTPAGVVDLFLSQGLEAAAGIRQPLEAAAREHPGLRVIEGRFMSIRQAGGTPKGREAGARYFAAFIEEAKASGFVRRALESSRQVDIAVAPAG